jgi:hypothetical protein
MATENLEAGALSTDVYFARAAARRQLTPEQLRAQLRTLADEAHASSNHLSFEKLRDASTVTLSDEDMAHLDQCRYCSRFMQTVLPTELEKDIFVTSALKRYAPQRRDFTRSVARYWPIPASITVGLLVGGLGVWTLSANHRASLPPPAAKLSYQGAPTLHWANTVKQRCTLAGGEVQSCEIFADAARYQLQGDSAIAQDLVTHGLERSGVRKPIIVQVKATLETKPASPERLPQAIAQAEAATVNDPNASTNSSLWLESARLHLVAGQDSKAYTAVGHFLKAEIPKAQSTAFLIGFVQPVSSYRMVNDGALTTPQEPLRAE